MTDLNELIGRLEKFDTPNSITKTLDDTRLIRALQKALGAQEPMGKAIFVETVRSAHSPLQAIAKGEADHMHCAAGCEKAQAETVDGHLVCARCGADFVPCTQETCG